jgi:hypothetical protein
VSKKKVGVEQGKVGHVRLVNASGPQIKGGHFYAKNEHLTKNARTEMAQKERKKAFKKYFFGPHTNPSQVF